MDGVDVSRLLELIDDYAGVTKKDIGRIDLKGAYSFFEVDPSKADDIMKGINGISYRGRPVRVELTDGKEGGSAPARRRESGSSKGGGKAKPAKKRFDKNSKWR